MIPIYNQKVAIISDIHLGIHTNSELWHKIVLDYGEWLKKELISKNIKDIIVLGDIFNDRSDIGVQTLHVAESFFKIFTEGLYNFNIILLVGNHDCFYHNKSDVNSTSIFKGWKNITVIDKLETVTWFDNQYTFMPWGIPLDTLPYNNAGIFAHLDINTFKVNSIKICEKGVDSDELLKKSSLIITGHYHTKQERIYPNGKILYLGCVFPQNWNDVSDKKYYHILDLKTQEYKSFENVISPKYYKIKLSDLFIKEKLQETKSIVNGNFIKIIVDKQINYEQFEKIQTVLNSLQPLDLSSDFNDETTIKTPENYESVNMEISTMIPEYIESLEKTELKDKIISEMDSIYKTALTRVKIESN
jgi:DNA repair exonuclease SbcCD nuclease subunit